MIPTTTPASGNEAAAVSKGLGDRLYSSDGQRLAPLERITRLVATTLATPLALVTLLDGGCPRTIASFGPYPGEALRPDAFDEQLLCDSGLLVVEDAAADERFRDEALVVGERGIRFYAGAPLVASNGAKLGCISALDFGPRAIAAEQSTLLREMAALVVSHLELRSELDEAASANEMLTAAIDASPAAIYTLTPDCIVTNWNEAAQRLFGWSAAELVGRRVAHIPPGYDGEAHATSMRAIYGREFVNGFVTRRRRKDGSLFDCRISCGPILDAAGAPNGAAYVAEDVTDALRWQQVEQLRFDLIELVATGATTQAVFDRLIETWQMIVPGTVGAIYRIRENRVFRAAGGDQLPAVFAGIFDGTRHGAADAALNNVPFGAETTIVADVEIDQRWAAHRELALASGIRSCWSTPICDSQGRLLGFVALYTGDVREPVQFELQCLTRGAQIAKMSIESNEAREKLEDMALRDGLTELPNRTLFDDRLQHVIATAKRTGARFALGLLDLSRFKEINDELGHAAGDRLLKEVASRLQRVVRPQDTIARMGGDEFLFLITDIEDRDAAQRVAERFLGALEPSFAPEGREVAVRASLGLSVFPDDATEPTQLLRLADAAMYIAKSSGRSIGFHTSPGNGSPEDLEGELMRALENREFELHYHSMFSLATGQPTMAEALLRWNHPRLGCLAPDRFMTLAEQAGLMLPIGEWVLAESCRFARRWALAGGPGTVSVNISPRQFEERAFVASVAAALESSGLEPKRLWLEITEDLIHRSPENAATTLADLHRLGVRCSIDDFGRGYSSLNYLKRFPVNGLKIDRSFVAEIGRKDAAPGDEAIVGAILAVGRALRLSVVAEGIESQAQRDFLRARGCEFGQGYLFGRPLPERELLG